MTNELDNIVHWIAEKTFEDLAFIFSDPEDEAQWTDAEPFNFLGVSFSGAFSGRLNMRVSSAVLPELAGNMLGIDEDETTGDDQLDAACETLNVICGNLLPEIAGKQAIFNIGAPAVIEEQAVDPKNTAGISRGHAVLPMENGLCEMVLMIDGEVTIQPIPGEDN